MPIGIPIVAIVVVAVIVMIARRLRGDSLDDRGPYSSAMETRGEFAALGTTMDEPANPGSEDAPGANRSD